MRVQILPFALGERKKLKKFQWIDHSFAPVVQWENTSLIFLRFRVQILPLASGERQCQKRVLLDLY
jgi:hypothetical protein